MPLYQSTAPERLGATSRRTASPIFPAWTKFKTPTERFVYAEERVLALLRKGVFFVTDCFLTCTRGQLQFVGELLHGRRITGDSSGLLHIDGGGGYFAVAPEIVEARTKLIAMPGRNSGDGKGQLWIKSGRRPVAGYKTMKVGNRDGAHRTPVHDLDEKLWLPDVDTIEEAKAATECEVPLALGFRALSQAGHGCALRINAPKNRQSRVVRFREDKPDDSLERIPPDEQADVGALLQLARDLAAENAKLRGDDGEDEKKKAGLMARFRGKGK